MLMTWPFNAMSQISDFLKTFLERVVARHSVGLYSSHGLILGLRMVSSI